MYIAKHSRQCLIVRNSDSESLYYLCFSSDRDKSEELIIIMHFRTLNALKM